MALKPLNNVKQLLAASDMRLKIAGWSPLASDASDPASCGATH